MFVQDYYYYYSATGNVTHSRFYWSTTLIGKEETHNDLRGEVQLLLRTFSTFLLLLLHLKVKSDFMSGLFIDLFKPTWRMKSMYFQIHKSFLLTNQPQTNNWACCVNGGEICLQRDPHCRVSLDLISKQICLHPCLPVCLWPAQFLPLSSTLYSGSSNWSEQPGRTVFF